MEIDDAIARVETARAIMRQAQWIIADTQSTPVADLSIAAMYAALDIATAHNETPIRAIHWMRSALDHMEQRLGGDDDAATISTFG
jgi:ABC-type phosphate/phosphonate transport system ATPase subunit